MSVSSAARTAEESQQTLDNEHLVQLGLVDALVDAVQAGEGHEDVAKILTQFIDYTELHFMSEQLLMRLHAYPNYEEHVGDHESMIERLQTLREEFSGETMELTATRAQQLKGELMGHIRNRDAALHVFISGLRDEG